MQQIFLYLHNVTSVWLSVQISKVFYGYLQDSGAQLSCRWPWWVGDTVCPLMLYYLLLHLSLRPACPLFLHSELSYIFQHESYSAETLTMLLPAELVLVWMPEAAGWPGGGGGLRCGGPWSPSPSGAKAGGAGRLMIAVVMRPLLQLTLLLSSVFRLRFERLWKRRKNKYDQLVYKWFRWCMKFIFLALMGVKKITWKPHYQKQKSFFCLYKCSAVKFSLCIIYT